MDGEASSEKKQETYIKLMRFFRKEKPVPPVPGNHELNVDLKTGLWDGKTPAASRPPRMFIDGVDEHVQPWPTEPKFEEHL